MGCMRIVTTMIILSLLVLPRVAWCEATAIAEKGQALEVSSRSLESDGGLQQVTFMGDVVARQGALTLKAAKLVVYYQGENNRISRVEAIGDVTIEKDGRVATGGRGIYEIGKEKITLTESPRVQQGNNSVEGDEIVFFLNEDRSIVKSKTGSRVRAIMTPKGNIVGP